MCDSAEKAGCPNEGTVLIPAADNYLDVDLRLCPECAGSVAAMNKVTTGRALSDENLAELAELAKTDPPIFTRARDVVKAYHDKAEAEEAEKEDKNGN